MLYYVKHCSSFAIFTHLPRQGIPMTHSDIDQIGCPVARTADIISNKWTPLILRDLEHGQKRFSELERSLVGVSPKTLSERLKRLEEVEVVNRRCFAEVPPRVEYSLTEKGHDLLPLIECMRVFGQRWLIGEPCEAEADNETVQVAALVP
jgi:DNA-binding HxlR family transcriptional regulator